MQSIETVSDPIDAIVRFIPESNRPMCHQVLYQVRIDPDNLSPSGEYIRFNYNSQDGETVSEIHGWKRVDEIEIMEILKTYAQDSAIDMVA